MKISITCLVAISILSLSACGSLFLSQEEFVRRSEWRTLGAMLEACGVPTRWWSGNMDYAYACRSPEAQQRFTNYVNERPHLKQKFPDDYDSY